MSVRATLLALALVLLGGAALGACKRSQASTAAVSDEPALVVKPDSEGLLLTWIDDKGDFHVETKVLDVPMTGRDSVRVVDPNRDESGRSDHILVADLREARPDGSYPVRMMSRVDFEALAVGRREKAGPTMASPAPPEPSSSAASATAPDLGAGKSPVRATVTIYGAEWCGACHDAARYLRRKGIAYVEKDIEKDPAAAREMQAKLSRAGLRAGSIPVIEVRGKVMVGFNPADVEAALGQAL